VFHLITFYRAERATMVGRAGRVSHHHSDILRAAVVLLHATLEDGLRSLLWHLLPRSPETLSEIGLVGLNNHGRPEKFHLGELCRFRGKRVEELFEESISAYLQRESYNNVGDVVRTLKTIGFDPAKHATQLKLISALIQRRHKIVHNADIDESRGAGHQFTRSIKVSDVEKWTEAVNILLRDACSYFGAIEQMGSRPSGDVSKNVPKRVRKRAQGEAAMGPGESHGVTS